MLLLQMYGEKDWDTRLHEQINQRLRKTQNKKTPQKTTKSYQTIACCFLLFRKSRAKFRCTSNFLLFKIQEWSFDQRRTTTSSSSSREAILLWDNSSPPPTPPPGVPVAEQWAAANLIRARRNGWILLDALWRWSTRPGQDGETAVGESSDRKWVPFTDEGKDDDDDDDGALLTTTW